MTDSATLFTAAEAADAVGGSLVGDSLALIESVVVDSRRVEGRSLFVALPGEKSDGHAYVAASLRAGASCVFARADRRAELEAECLALAREGELPIIAGGGGRYGRAVSDAKYALQMGLPGI